MRDPEARIEELELRRTYPDDYLSASECAGRAADAVWVAEAADRFADALRRTA